MLAALAVGAALPGLVGLTGIAPAPLASARPAASAPAKPYDVDGDGYPELVAGAPMLEVDGVSAGGVVVLPGSAKGLTLAGTVVTQSSPDVAGDSENADHFGGAVASADFDRDGYADLAVGHGYESRPGAEFGGAVTVLYGSKDGLTGTRSLELEQPGGAQADAGFGEPLAAADLDGDGFPDLAVGAPYGDRVYLPGQDDAASGVVAVFRGGAAGLSQARADVLHGRQALPDDDVHFGSSLAVGDLDSDGTTDLVVGSAGSRFDTHGGYAGTVSACFGGAAGPTCKRLVHKDALADLTSVAVGNVSSSSRPEVVVGVPLPDDRARRGGAVWTLSLSGDRSLLKVRASAFTQASKGVPGGDARGDDFGDAVAVGDLDGDGYADLVVGAPGEWNGKAANAGRITVVHGGKKGYRASGGTTYDQSTKGVPGSSETADYFGSALTLLDHDADGHLDLTVGVPGENGFGGAVVTLAGAGKGFTTKGARALGLRTFAYPTRNRAAFGATLGS